MQIYVKRKKKKYGAIFKRFNVRVHHIFCYLFILFFLILEATITIFIMMVILNSFKFQLAAVAFNKIHYTPIHVSYYRFAVARVIELKLYFKPNRKSFTHLECTLQYCSESAIKKDE